MLDHSKETRFFQVLMLGYLLAQLTCVGLAFFTRDLNANQLFWYIIIPPFSGFLWLFGSLNSTQHRRKAASLLAGLALTLFLLYSGAELYDWIALPLIVLGMLFFGFFWGGSWFTTHSGMERLMLGFALVALLMVPLSVGFFLLFPMKWGGGLLLAFLAAYFLIKLYSEPGCLSQFASSFSDIRSIDAQRLAVLAGVFMVQAFFLHHTFPHGHQESYFEFVRLAIEDNQFPPVELPVGMRVHVHYANLSVAVFWSGVLGVSAQVAVFFELLSSSFALYMAVLYFSRMLPGNSEAISLASIFAVGLFGELHAYPFMFETLFNGTDWSTLIPSRAALYDYRTRMTSLLYPWGLSNYIDAGKSWATLLFSLYFLIQEPNKKRILFCCGLITVLCIAMGMAHLFYTLGLFGLLLLIFNHKMVLRNLPGYLWFVFGMIAACPFWYWIATFHEAASVNAGGELIPPKDWAIYLFMKNPIHLFNGDLLKFESIKYLFLEFGLLLPLAYFGLRQFREADQKRTWAVFFLTLFLVILIGFGYDLANAEQWEMQRFFNPSMFMLRLFAGYGFWHLFQRSRSGSLVVVLVSSVVFFTTVLHGHAYFLRPTEVAPLLPFFQ